MEAGPVTAPPLLSDAAEAVPPQERCDRRQPQPHRSAQTDQHAMNQSKLIALLGIILVVVLTVSSTVYTVDERERVIVVRPVKCCAMTTRPVCTSRCRSSTRCAISIRAS